MVLNVKTFILTLPEYPLRIERMSKLRQALSSIGMQHDIYNGVNGRDITMQTTDVNHLKSIRYKNDNRLYDVTKRLSGEIMSRGEIGCAWSHLNLLKQLLEEPSEINYYLILEDDAEFLKPIKELNDLLLSIPEDLDMCHLAKSEWYPFTKTKQINDFFYECKKVTFFNRTTAYLISKKGAEKALAYCNNHIDIPIDDLYNVLYRMTPNFRFYVSYSYFFKEQPDATSCITDINQL